MAPGVETDYPDEVEARYVFIQGILWDDSWCGLYERGWIVCNGTFIVHLGEACDAEC